MEKETEARGSRWPLERSFLSLPAAARGDVPLWPLVSFSIKKEGRRGFLTESKRGSWRPARPPQRLPTPCLSRRAPLGQTGRPRRVWPLPSPPPGLSSETKIARGLRPVVAQGHAT